MWTPVRVAWLEGGQAPQEQEAPGSTDLKASGSPHGDRHGRRWKPLRMRMLARRDAGGLADAGPMRRKTTPAVYVRGSGSHGTGGIDDATDVTCARRKFPPRGPSPRGTRI